jgi:hypothetical protein
MPIPKVIFVQATSAEDRESIRDELDTFLLDLIISGADQEEEDELEYALATSSSSGSKRSQKTSSRHTKKTTPRL